MTYSYKSKDDLEELYWDKEMSTREVANEIGCSRSTIRRWLDKFNLGSRTRVEGLRTSHEVNRAHYHYDSGGMCWKDTKIDERVGVHQLLAVADGYDPGDVWDDDTVVHHKTGFGWLNIPGTVEVLSRSDHVKTHNENEWEENSEIPQLVTKSDV